MMEGIASSFEAEFDYTKEAKLQLGCYKNLPAVDYVSIPQVNICSEPNSSHSLEHTFIVAATFISRTIQ